MNATPESLIKDYADPIEQQEIDKFVCSEMGRQIHRYIKGMSGTKQAMLKFEERLASLSVPEKEKAIAKYIDLNRKALDGLDLKMILVRSVAKTIVTPSSICWILSTISARWFSITSASRRNTFNIMKYLSKMASLV